jgi:type 1 glutamine amidotransferase
MAYMVLGATTIPIAAGSVTEEREIIGSISRAFDGTARQDIQDIKRKWTMTTTPMTAAAYSTLLGIVETGGGVVAMSGDIVGSSTNVYVVVKNSKHVGGMVSGSWVETMRICDLEVWEA